MARTSRVITVAASLLTMVAWAFLWTYLRTSLHAPLFSSFAAFDPTLAYIALVALVFVIATCAAALQGKVAGVFDNPFVALGAGVAGTVAMAVLAGPLCGASAGGTPWGPLLANCCLLVVALAFCALFFGWVQESLRQTYSLGVDVESVLLIVAAVASFAIAFEVTDDAPRMATVGTAGYAVMGVCLFCVRLIARKLEGAGAEGVAGSAEFACVEGAGAEAGGAGGRSAASRRRARQQVALLAVAGAVVSLMSYAHYFGMDDQTVRCGQVSDILLFVALGLFVAFMLYVNRNSLRRTRATLPVVLCLVAVVFVVLLVAMFVFMSSNVFAYGSSRFVRRLSLVIAGISTLIVVYRYGLAPVRTFTIAFLGPALVMKPVQVALLTWAPAVAEGLGNGILTSAAIALGLCLTMFLVVFCLANFNDQLARALLAGSGPRGDAGAADGASAAGLAGNAGLAGDATSDAESREEARRAACEAVRKAHGLTSRETDILFHFSGGATAQATADALTISTNTVNTHAMSLYRKLDVHTKQELIDLVRGRMRG